MQVERIIVNFNPVFGLRNRRRGLKRFSCFSRKRTDLSKKKLHGVCTLTKVYQYAKEERFLFFEPCRTLVDICMELLLKRGRKAIVYLRIIVHWKYALPRQLVYNFGSLSLKIVKLAFHLLEVDFGHFVSSTATVITLPKNHQRSVLFWLSVYFIFSEIKMQNFRDDASLVQEIYSFIHDLWHKCF